jgi:threonyl-tRNA synthetase
VRFVMNALDFRNFKVRLSFRDPDNKDKFVGSDDLWETAEEAIRNAAETSALDYTIGLGEAAFYGPKIDFMVRDAIGREWQLGTVQLDYNLPERFQLEYTGQDGAKHRPVMIHRAPFGSLERFIGVLIEHYGGNFPFWLAPTQAIVLPISENYLDYAREVDARLRAAGVRSEVDERNEKIGYKIREAELMKIPYMLIVGEQERAAGVAAVRVHGEGDKGKQAIDDIIAGFRELNDTERLGLGTDAATVEPAVEITDDEAIQHAVPDSRD